MIVSRALSFFLRFAQFVCGAVVLGLVAHFLHQHHKTHAGPIGREIYTEVVAALSVVLSLIWMIPFTSTFLHYTTDFILSAAWFAAFGTLVNWIHKANCGGAFQWGGIHRGGYCGQWKATEAFSFLSAIFWLASAALGIHVVHRGTREATTSRGSRWSRRHAV
ncbi:integral membrane protein [Trichodelitschia bisporula]|uniref:Integral membrane protein n=1 Tax=Trichodelitschia bisporula TaxID=703511 RepID=A0A6G1HRA5_9PEZI|nr:integral membrane protein [Trichodelitschia bisporula]